MKRNTLTKLGIGLAALGWVAVGGAPVALAASPTVDAVLALPRTEPRRQVEVALTLLDLQEREAAESIGEELAALRINKAERERLVAQVGTARLARIARELPATADFVRSCLDAASEAATSPKRLAQLVEQIGSDDRAAVTEALQGLRLTGEAGVAPCLDAIAATDDAKRQARLREALVALDPLSVPALYAALADENPSVQTQAAYALGRLAELDRLRSPLAAALLAGPAVATPSGDAFGQAARWAYVQMTGAPASTTEAGRRIDGAIRELLAGGAPFLTDGDGRIAWRPNRSAEIASVPSRTVAIDLAARLAGDRLTLGPASEGLRRRAAMLAAEAGAPGANAFETLPTHELNTTLREAIELQLHAAAAACCESLGARRDSAALLTTGGRIAPLAAALEASDPAVRFAAIEAILAIDPRSPFPGSSRVADALVYFASGRGENVAVVAYPTLAAAGQTAGSLIGAGYAATPAHRGSDAVRLASGSPDTRLVLIDLATLRPSARETLFRLRRTPATAAVPVALLAADGRLAEAAALAQEHGGHTGRVIATPRPHTPEAVAAIAERLERLAPAGAGDPETRRRRAAAAREAIGRLLGEGPAFYRLQEHAAAIEQIAMTNVDPASVSTLAGVGTQASQLRLIDAASLESRPLADRRAAAEAFAASVRRHGLLLTSGPVRRQYDRYNASVSADADTQQLLGDLLDVIESRRARVAR